MQRSWRDDPKYKDTEFVVYHYPHQYFDKIHSGANFVYYRPSRGATSQQSSAYFGCGELGDVWDDPYDATHRFVAIRKPIRFFRPVPYCDSTNTMFESRFKSRSGFQGHSVRFIDDVDYYRILSAAGLTGAMISGAATVDDVLAGLTSPLSSPPLDSLRPLLMVPEGTGYRPIGDGPDVYESAALQERARFDHQATLRLLKNEIDAIGGSCEFNNNIDLLANFGDQRFLIEVKSLNNPASTVDRMRYGMGQLFDYSVRYRAKIGNARPVLAFGSVPNRDVAWISDILQGNGVAFVARERDLIKPMNELAREFPVFH